ncbi:PEP-CTERM sorting domain-containing protein [Paraglaciecola sp.]|nr:PEP-CTERM sorting domain-containing protein [Paraglaciecola sp.]
MLKKKLLVSVIAGLCSLSTQAATEFSYDGHYVESEYDIAFAVDYDLGNGKKAEGGTLAFSTHDGKQYMYIAHPLGFKDLSYAEETNFKKASPSAPDPNDYLVGWEDSKQENAEKAMKSEYFTLSFASDNGVQALKFDPRIPGLSDSDVSKGVEENKVNDVRLNLNTDTPPNQIAVTDNGLSISFLSTLNYNASLLNDGDFFGSLGDFYDRSPKTVKCGNGLTSDETSSAEACYELADESRNDIFTDEKTWDFNFGIEVEVSGNLFGDGFDITSLLPQNFGVNNAGNTVAGYTVLVSLDGLHASSPKVPCNDGKGIGDDNKSPCDVTITKIPPGNGPTPVPEPSVLALIGLGIMGIWYRRRKTA